MKRILSAILIGLLLLMNICSYALAEAENIDDPNEVAYQQAVEWFSLGEYEQAKEAFLALEDYQDSADRVAKIDEIIPTLDREINIEETEYYLYQGNKTKLEPTVNKLTEDAQDDTSIIFSTSDQKVAKVAKDGTITAAQPGNAYVFCKAADNEYILKAVTVHVVKSVSRIILSANKYDLSLPEQNGNSIGQLTVKIEPEDAYVQTGKWSSNNDEIVTVDQDGNLKAVSTGRAVITFTSDDESKGKKMATCNVNVVQAVTGLALAETSGTIFVGKQLQLKPTFEPEKVTNKALTWTTSNESIAIVTANGMVKGIAPGEATITASSSDGPSVQFKATVKIAPVTLKITGKAKCIARNHVGKHWSKEFELNGEPIKGTAKITVENGDTITIECTITENDANPESGTFSRKIEITPEIMTKGISIEETVWVTENGGRYSGNSAEWRVEFSIKP